MSERTTVELNLDELRDRVLGCWTGKNIGGTLGGPFEGAREILDIKGYSTPPGEPLPNDDLDLQLVWLKAVQDRGPLGVDAAVLGEYWLNYVTPHWNEYGISKANQRMGLPAPLCGAIDNHWQNSNGAWIRSELWACLAPGAPDLAVRFAYEDASVDHGGGEGVYAEMFTAAVQSAAFLTGDTQALLRAGLSRIPAGCRVARAIGVAVEAHRSGATWQDAREAVVEDAADLGWFQAPANLAFFVIGWLYGAGDFGASITIAANCGDDTDCTAATLGALLGIVHGRSGIPTEWIEPIGERILTVAVDRGSFVPPATVGALTDQVLELTPRFLAAHHAPVLVTSGPTRLPALNGQISSPSPATVALWQRTPYQHTVDAIHTRITVDYLSEPLVRPGVPCTVEVSLQSNLPDRRDLELEWILPDGWEVLPGRRSHVVVDSATTSADALEAHIGNAPTPWPPVSRFRFDIVPKGELPRLSRVILQVTATGRPTVGLVSLTFLAQATAAEPQNR